MIRALRIEDIDKLREIHRKYYEKEFDFPDFLNNFICVFTVTNNEGIVSTGGVRSIFEIVAITDKDKSVRERRSALYQILDASQFVANGEALHVFVQDEVWMNHLTKIGFKSTKGKALVL